MVETKDTLGKKIQLLRQEKNISQKELAELIEKTTSDVAMWEADETTPSIADIVKLSSVFGKSTDYFLMDTELLEDVKEEPIKESWPEAEVKNERPVQEITKTKKKNPKQIIIPAIVLVVLVLAGIAFTCFLNLPFSKSTRKIESAAASVVKIYCYDYDGNDSATGSGFIVFDDQTVVTNYHVMSEAYSCKVSTDEDKTFEVENIIAYSKENDIAIIKLKEPTGLKVLELGESDKVKKGETVTAIGSPLGLKNTVSQGVLSGRQMEDNMDVLQFTAAISHGSSGGALFDENGKVIGVTSASLVEGQSLNFAIPSECVNKVFNEKKSPSNVNSIFFQENPVYKMLEQSTEVTIEDLKANPKRYNGKQIAIDTYISSATIKVDYYGANSLSFEGYISNYEDISGDWSEDFSRDYSGKTLESPVIEISRKAMVDRDSLPIDETIVPGNHVIVIGVFNYHEGVPYDKSNENSGYTDFISEFNSFDRMSITVELVLKK